MAASFVDNILKLTTLIPALPQAITNGASVLGTLAAPTLPECLPSNVTGWPWGDRTAAFTNPYEDAPDTGIVRSYDFTIKRTVLAPDGVNRTLLLVNDQFPGPTIEANWGDTFSITVHNNITDPEEGTAIHWHGLLQKATPWFDGVPSVSQCPIAPGKSMTYTFKAELYGTSWWHSHYSAQYAGGLFGPMIVYGPTNLPYDVDLGPILLNDYYYKNYMQIVEEAIASPPPPPPPSDTVLINGKMIANCSNVTDLTCIPNAGVAKFRFQAGKTHRLRLINSGAESVQRFTIDDHNMTVIANDWLPVQPYDTNMVTLGVGQRTDVLVTADMPLDTAVWMRTDISETCSKSGQPHGVAAIYYDNADTNGVPRSEHQIYDDGYCGNDPLSKTIPYFPFSPIKDPSFFQTIDVVGMPNASGNFLWYMNNQTFRGNYNFPLLVLSNQGNTSYPDNPEWNVYNYGTNASIRAIIKGTFPASHPMHLHGHNFNILAEGIGEWDGTIEHPYNTQRRDVQLLPPGTPDKPGYIVIQYDTDNPGVWPLHCHAAWHLSAGFYVNLMEQTPLIKERELPDIVGQTCRDWGAYTGDHTVLEIDSGV